MEVKESSHAYPIFIESFKRHLQQSDTEVKVMNVDKGEEVGISESEFIAINTPVERSGKVDYFIGVKIRKFNTSDRKNRRQPRNSNISS